MENDQMNEDAIVEDGENEYEPVDPKVMEPRDDSSSWSKFIFKKINFTKFLFFIIIKLFLCVSISRTFFSLFF